MSFSNGEKKSKNCKIINWKIDNTHSFLKQKLKFYILAINSPITLLSWKKETRGENKLASNNKTGRRVHRRLKFFVESQHIE